MFGIFFHGNELSGSDLLGGKHMLVRGKKYPVALLALSLVLAIASIADAFDGRYRYPVKVRVSGAEYEGQRSGSMGLAAYDDPGAWGYAAGASSRAILCPRRGFDFVIGARPFFSDLSGNVKALSRGGEGTYLNLHGHLRLPSDNIFWEFYSYVRLWDKVTLRLEYDPWFWSGTGHAATEGNFAGVLFAQDDPIQASLGITQLLAGADYDVSFSDDLVFGPNADFHIIRWNQRVVNKDGVGGDFGQTILQPALGAHARYEPSNTGYFSWFKPYLEGRFSWMSFTGLGLSTWDFGAGVSPPLSRNVDTGMKVGFKQWKMYGNRQRLFTDISVEGVYLDFSFRF